jgi:hypothetical protein
MRSFLCNNNKKNTLNLLSLLFLILLLYNLEREYRQNFDELKEKINPLLLLFFIKSNIILFLYELLFLFQTNKNNKTRDNIKNK